MYLRIAAALIVAVFLAGTHWKAYTKGQDAITAEWDRDIAQRTSQALEAEKAARARESELQTKVGRIDRAYQDQKRATQHVARAAADGLRNLETILTAPSSPASDAVATSGNHGAGGLERELLGQCASALAGLGQEADRLAVKVVTLQEYIKALK